MSRPPAFLCPSTGEGVGLGHLHRCLALAEAMPGARVLKGAFPDWSDELAEGAVVVLDTLHHGNAAATMANVAALHGAGARVAVIDSMPPDHYPADAVGAALPDWLITPYLSADRMRPPPQAGQWLHGPRYAILPAAFAKARVELSARPTGRLLVTCGGVDPDGLSPRIAEVCAAGRHPVDIVIGPQFRAQDIAALEALAEAVPGLRLHRNLQSLLPFYLSAQAVIGRPGLIRYEAAALGRRGIYLWEGERYRTYFEAFRDTGVAEVYLSPGEETAFFDRVSQIAQSDPSALPPVPHLAALKMVDAEGAARIARALLQERGAVHP